MIKLGDKKLKEIRLGYKNVSKAFTGDKLLRSKPHVGSVTYKLIAGQPVALNLKGGSTYLFLTADAVSIKYTEFSNNQEKTIRDGSKWTVPSFGKDFKAISKSNTTLTVVKQ